MALLAFLQMNALQAARFREDTAGLSNRLEPVQGRGTGYASNWYLPERVLFDPAHAASHDVLRMLPAVAIDIEVVFPPTPEVLTD